MKVDPAAFVAACRAYLGVKFKHRGRTRHGLDCAGLVVCALRDLGHDPIDLKVYGREPARDGLRRVVEQNMGPPVSDGSMLPGDVVLMRFVSDPHHVAVLGDHPTAGLSIVHCFGDVGKVVEHRLDEHWREKILAVYRFEVAQ